MRSVYVSHRGRPRLSWNTGTKPSPPSVTRPPRRSLPFQTQNPVSPPVPVSGPGVVQQWHRTGFPFFFGGTRHGTVPRFWGGQNNGTTGGSAEGPPNTGPTKDTGPTPVDAPVKISILYGTALDHPSLRSLPLRSFKVGPVSFGRMSYTRRYISLAVESVRGR
jgi:hypothetical protein